MSKNKTNNIFEKRKKEETERKKRINENLKLNFISKIYDKCINRLIDIIVSILDPKLKKLAEKFISKKVDEFDKMIESMIKQLDNEIDETEMQAKQSNETKNESVENEKNNLIKAIDNLLPKHYSIDDLEAKTVNELRNIILEKIGE